MSHIWKLLVAGLIAISGVTFAHRAETAEAYSCNLYLASRLAQATCSDVDDHVGFRIVATATCSCSIYARKVYGEWWGPGGWSTASLPSSWYNSGWRFVHATVRWYR
jgi:hypothetical protein